MVGLVVMVYYHIIIIPVGSLGSGLVGIPWVCLSSLILLCGWTGWTTCRLKKNIAEIPPVFPLFPPTFHCFLFLFCESFVFVPFWPYFCTRFMCSTINVFQLLRLQYYLLELAVIYY